ncbi:MAG: ATP-binding protein [Candidatus Diapherotrites archaeon]|uniref:ATP-binding protein n=1 Tax=Candidatus Iainarchaeum sp. TaxID=3101447 RepID=A0A8T3YM87_9ARCH|nr:ATP-binding protein [Candidatus Diapherotrites archaeon]
MSYEIPRNLKYEEKVLFNLSIWQAAWLGSFSLGGAALFMKAAIPLEARILAALALALLGAGFAFFGLKEHLLTALAFASGPRNVTKPGQCARKFVGVKEVRGDCMVTDSGSMKAVIRVWALNFHILSRMQQEAVICAYRDFLNSLDFPIQIAVRTVPLSLEAYLRRMMENAEARKDEAACSRTARFGSFINGFITANAVKDRLFYVVVPGPPPGTENGSGNCYTERALDARAGLCMDKLRKCGVKAARLSGAEIAEMLSGCFGGAAEGFAWHEESGRPGKIRGSAAAAENWPRNPDADASEHRGLKPAGSHKLPSTENDPTQNPAMNGGGPFWVAEHHRLKQGTATTQKAAGAGGALRWPLTGHAHVRRGGNETGRTCKGRAAVMADRPRHLELNGELNRVIAASGYPRNIREGWLDAIVSAEGNFDIGIHIKPSGIEDTMTRLNMELVRQEADLLAAELKGIVNPSLRLQHRDTMNVLEKLQNGEDKLFNIALYLNARADTPERLELLSGMISSELNSIMVIPKVPYMRMRDGIRSVFPLQEDRLKADRNIPGDALSACFPFTTAFLNADEDGILFGVGTANKVPVIIDPFRLPNHNGIILGTSGGGKSFAAKLFIGRSLLNGVKTVIIDPQGEYSAMTRKHGGQVVEIGADGGASINPLDLMGMGLGEKMLSLQGVFGILLGELTEQQRHILEMACEAAFARKGISMGDRESWRKEPPVLSDVHSEIARARSSAASGERQFYESLGSRLRIYCASGQFSCINRQTHADFKGSLISFSISSMPERLRPALMYLIMEYVQGRMKADGERKLLVVDEAWSLLRHGGHAQHMFEMIKTARKFNMGIVVITQEAEDLLSSQAGKSVLANTSWKFLARQDPSAMELLAQKFGLNRSEQGFLMSANPGEGLLMVMNDRVTLNVISSAEEYGFATSKPGEMSGDGKALQPKDF